MKKWFLRIAFLLGWFFGPIGLLERWRIQDKFWLDYFGLVGLEDVISFLPATLGKPLVGIMFIIWGLGFFWWIYSLKLLK